MGGCLSSVKHLFRKRVAQEEYIYLPARSPKRSFHTPKPVTTATSTTSSAAPGGADATRAEGEQQQQHQQHAAPVPVDPEVVRRQHDELIQRQSSFIHLKLSVETLVRENKALGADDGDEILAWLETTEGSPATIYQDILDTKNILAELKKQQEDLQGRPQAPAATSTRRGARSKSKNTFAAVEAE